MMHDSLDAFLRSTAKPSKGPIALILAEDATEIPSTLQHHIQIGFPQILLLTDTDHAIPEDLADRIQQIRYETKAENALPNAVNAAIPAFPGQWLYACFNAEYLFFPFCENRTVGEMLAFHTEERRDAMLTYVVDLYAGNLDAHPDAVSLEDAHLDRSGYYALGRRARADAFHDRQLDFYGGLRWRFEEHVPKARRRIDRIAIFRARPSLEMRPDQTFTDEEYNTYSCPWHHNLTAAICSFRTAKALRKNPGSRHDIHTFQWRNSAPFEWRSQQLLDLGLMEPGQWF
ncbi:hypothetical protein AADZ90_018975 [Aestuariibius sp. 2305UL40-4]|uniref:hypothetical protein n=1 Tax=Aestuariibius violaceus TaxID=3234132 RepID=UPI00345E5331